MSMFCCKDPKQFGVNNKLMDFPNAVNFAKNNNKNILILFDYFSSNHSKKLSEILNDKKNIKLIDRFVFVHLYVDDFKIDSLTKQRAGLVNLNLLNSFDSLSNCPCFVLYNPNNKLNSRALNVNANNFELEFENEIINFK